MQRMKVAAVQMNALKDNLEHNMSIHVQFIRQAADQGCQLVVFPELSVTAHYGDEKVAQFAMEADRGRIFDVIHAEAQAASILVSYGFCELAHGTYYNTQALVGPAGLIGIQRKTHASQDEYFTFRMGRSLEVFDVGPCRIGTLICYDSNFCEAWRVLTLKGAEVVLLPHASRSGWGEKIAAEEQLAGLQKRLARYPAHQGMHAEENAVFAVFANQVGFNGHSTHTGGAYIFSPVGGMIVNSPASLDDLLISAELDPEDLDKARRHPSCTIKTRRPELYGEVTRMI